MTTLREQLEEAAKEVGDEPNHLVCLYQPIPEDEHIKRYPGWHSEECGDVIQCAIEGLPTDDFYAGYGSPQGSPCIAYSERYVYVHTQYDGSEWFSTIPRHPQYVTKPIPWPGG